MTWVYNLIMLAGMRVWLVCGGWATIHSLQRQKHANGWIRQKMMRFATIQPFLFPIFTPLQREIEIQA